MPLEKLGLLEELLEGFIQQFVQLEEEKSVLEKRLEDKSRRLSDLEGEVEELRRERVLIRERLGPIVEKVERLETLEEGESGL
ncbi:MAG: hypothetical protein HY900_32895 [Deltaproteobacteria bacterium]|nr:hypothetical protein [Deltaproteobacteria bacterium]